MKERSSRWAVALPVLVAATGAIIAATVAVAQLAKPKANVTQPITFSKEFLNNPKNIELGKKRFLQRCTYCHASHGFSGKAPQLRPSERTPEFIYERITNGFMERGMPPWEYVLPEGDRRALVAFIRSDPKKY